MAAAILAVFAARLVVTAAVLPEAFGLCPDSEPGRHTGGPEKMVVTANKPHYFTWPECVPGLSERYNYSKHGQL